MRAQAYFGDGVFRRYHAASNPLRFIDPNGLDYILVHGYAVYYYGTNGNMLAEAPIVSGYPNVFDPTAQMRGPTPSGNFTIEQPASPGNYSPAFCSGGTCFFIPLVPQFATPNDRCMLPGTAPKASGRCGLHPTPGLATAGCVGFPFASDAIRFRDLINNYKPAPHNPLWVIVTPY